MPLIDRLGVAAAILFALLAALVATSLLAPASRLARLTAAALPLAEVRSAAAEQGLAQGDGQAARRETEAELRVSPLREDAWLRLARIDVQQTGRWSADANAAISHSYDAVPYDLDPGSARIDTVLDRFSALSPTVQVDVRDELAAWASSPQLRPFLIGKVRRIADPATRAAVTTVIAGRDTP